MTRYVSNRGYADLPETSEYGQAWTKMAAKESKKYAPKRGRGRPRKFQRADFGFPMPFSDIKPFVSPIDGTEITSRSTLKAHEQRHGVKQCGDFKRGEIVKRENKRIAQTKRLADDRSIKWE